MKKKKMPMKPKDMPMKESEMGMRGKPMMPEMHNEIYKTPKKKGKKK